MYRVEVLAEVTAGASICPACERSFKKSRNTQAFCGSCKVEFECSSCKEFFTPPVHRINRKYLTKEAFFCSRACVNGPIICETHGAQQKSISGRCLACHHEALAGVCLEHGAYKGTSCMECLNKPRWINCKVHGPQQYSFGDCIACYNRQSWSEGNECFDHPEEPRLIHDGFSYSCWECFKSKFSKAHHEVLFSEKQRFQLTYRVFSDRSMGQEVMEQELAELGIGWFVYIKGYLKDEIWHPLVVGKTGSRLVQPSGTDIQFKIDGSNPGRTFLRETGLKWDSSKVLIIPAVDEVSALEFERFIQKERSLFSS